MTTSAVTEAPTPRQLLLRRSRLWRIEADRPGERHAKPRRRSELGLFFVGGIVVVAASLLASFGVQDQSGVSALRLPAHELELLLGLVAIAAVISFANRRLVPDADPLLLPIALVLNGLGFVMIQRLDPGSAGNQLAWTVIGLAGYVAILTFVRRSRDLDRYRYLLLGAAFVLLVLPLAPKLGSSSANQYGARLWIQLGPISFQPVEIAKLLLVIFFASYCVEKRELLTIPTRRVGDHLFPDLRAFGPIAVALAASLLIILGEHDIGFSVILFLVFLTLVWVTTGRWAYLVVGLVLFAAGTFLASHLLAQLDQRITIWLDPWKYPTTSGYQPIQGELAFGRGGVWGTGLGLGLAGGVPGVANSALVPVNTSDFIFSVFGEELGLIGTVALVVGYLLMIGSGLRAALRARSDFAKLVAVGLTVTLGFQAFFIMAGVLRLLPLTGVTLPFVSYGGSSLVANYVLLALLMRISNEGNAAPPSATSPARASAIGP